MFPFPFPLKLKAFTLLLDAVSKQMEAESNMYTLILFMHIYCNPNKYSSIIVFICGDTFSIIGIFHMFCIQRRRNIKTVSQNKF